MTGSEWSVEGAGGVGEDCKEKISCGTLTDCTPTEGNKSCPISCSNDCDVSGGAVTVSSGLSGEGEASSIEQDAEPSIETMSDGAGMSNPSGASMNILSKSLVVVGVSLFLRYI